MLEAAYNRDPKPDKAARVELVRQVSLGEKEVQVRAQITTRPVWCRLTPMPSDMVPKSATEFKKKVTATSAS